MRGSSRLLFVALALFAFAFSATAAIAAEPGVRILSDGQNAILSKNGLKAKVRADRGTDVTVKGLSATFDKPQFTALTESRSLAFRRSGAKTVELPLTKAGRRAVKSCQARTLRVKAGPGHATADLVRETKACKPKAIDISDASRCDFIREKHATLHAPEMPAAVPRRLLHGPRRLDRNRQADQPQDRRDAGQLIGPTGTHGRRPIQLK